MSNRKNNLAIGLAMFALAMAPILAPPASAQDSARSGAAHVRDGNKRIEEGKFPEALEAYDQAKIDLPESPEVSYDRGIALYKLGEFAKAESALQDALKPGHPELEAKAKYNLGRCAHAAALAKKDELQVAVNELTRAIRFYKDALQLDPKDADAASNQAAAERLMAFLERKLKEQKEQKKNPSSQPTSQPQDQPTSQPQEQQPSSQPSSQPTSQADQQQGDPQDEQQQQGEKQKDQKGEKGQKQDQTKKGEDQEKKGEAGEEGKEDEKEQQLKQQEVEPMLQEARDAEKKRREAKRQQMLRLRGRAPVSKDW